MQQISKIQFVLFIGALVFLDLSSALPQRPSYAGSRPSGIGQKDKYHISNNVNGSTDIANRFGTVEQNSLPFGMTQKPPAAHIGVVFPESNYVPLAVPTPSPNVVANRLGVDSDVTSNAVAGGVNNTSNIPQRLPIDAHNDSELVSILSRLPEHQRPFWFLNAAAIEAQRNGSFANYAGAVDSRGSFFG